MWSGFGRRIRVVIQIDAIFPIHVWVVCLIQRRPLLSQPISFGVREDRRFLFRGDVRFIRIVEDEPGFDHQPVLEELVFTDCSDPPRQQGDFEDEHREPVGETLPKRGFRRRSVGADLAVDAHETFADEAEFVLVHLGAAQSVRGQTVLERCSGAHDAEAPVVLEQVEGNERGVAVRAK